MWIIRSIVYLRDAAAAAAAMSNIQSGLLFCDFSMIASTLLCWPFLSLWYKRISWSTKHWCHSLNIIQFPILTKYFECSRMPWIMKTSDLQLCRFFWSFCLGFLLPKVHSHWPYVLCSILNICKSVLMFPLSEHEEDGRLIWLVFLLIVVVFSVFGSHTISIFNTHKMIIMLYPCWQTISAKYIFFNFGH